MHIFPRLSSISRLLVTPSGQPYVSPHGNINKLSQATTRAVGCPTNQMCLWHRISKHKWGIKQDSNPQNQLTIKQQQKKSHFTNREENVQDSHDANLHAQPG